MDAALPSWTNRSRDESRDVRNDLARELHDRVAQTLTTMLVEMENFKALEFGREQAIDQVTAYQESTRAVLGHIRSILYDLREDEEDVGQDFAARVRRMLELFEEKTGIKASLTVSSSWPRRLAAQAAVNLYRVLEEALNNVRLHSGARIVRVSFAIEDNDQAIVSVRDDGSGPDRFVGERLGFGVLGMRERALLLGGELTVQAISPHGTQLTAVIPKERLQ